MDSAGPQPALRYRWTGREYDAETGFYFHRSRYYDPGVGRFVQEDRIGYAGGGNLYAYVNGNVLQTRDPEGLTKEIVLNDQPPLGWWADFRLGMMLAYCDGPGITCRFTGGVAASSAFGSLITSVWARQLLALPGGVHGGSEAMREALKQCVINVVCAEVVTLIEMDEIDVDIDFGDPTTIDPEAEGGATRIGQHPFNDLIVYAFTLIDREYALKEYHEFGLIITHELGHVADAASFGAFEWKALGEQSQESTTRGRWDARYCATARVCRK